MLELAVFNGIKSKNKWNFDYKFNLTFSKWIQLHVRSLAVFKSEFGNHLNKYILQLLWTGCQPFLFQKMYNGIFIRTDG